MFPLLMGIKYKVLESQLGAEPKANLFTTSLVQNTR